MLHVKISNNRDNDVFEYALPADYIFTTITPEALNYMKKKDSDWFWHGIRFTIVFNRDYAEKDLF